MYTYILNLHMFAGFFFFFFNETYTFMYSFSCATKYEFTEIYLDMYRVIKWGLTHFLSCALKYEFK